MLTIAGGIVLGVLILVYLPDILAAATGVVIALVALAGTAGLIYTVTSGDWQDVAALVFLAASIVAGFYLHHRRQGDEQGGPVDEPNADQPPLQSRLFRSPSSGRMLHLSFSADQESAADNSD